MKNSVPLNIITTRVSAFLSTLLLSSSFILTMANNVDDDTDLTTLVGENGRFKMLVESKFQSEVGNLTWGEAQVFTKDEFLEEYGSGNPVIRNKLLAWIVCYSLGDRFKEAPGRPPRPQQQQQPANILGEGVYDKLAASTVFFKDGEGNAIGTGFTFSGNRAMTAAHNFPDAEIGSKVVGYFGKPQAGACCNFEVLSVDKELDYCVLKRDSGEEFAVWLELKGPGDHIRPGQVCILAAFQIGLHRDLADLDPDHTIGVYQGNIVKTHARHFVYSCPSFAGDSGGAIVWQNGRVIGLHQETVNQALERKRQHEMDLEDRIGSVEESLDSLTANVSSGAIGLSVVAVPQHLLVGS